MIIKIHPTVCRVKGTYEETQWLRKILSIDVPGAKYTTLYRRNQWDGFKRFYNPVAKTFPVGLLSYVLSEETEFKIEVIDERNCKEFDQIIPELNNIEFRDYQKQGVLACLKHKNCIIESATNSGKTAMFSALIKKMHPMNILVLIHRSEILWQIKKEVETLTGLPVGVITSKGVDLKPVTVAMMATLSNRIGVDEDITEFFESTDCVICDECHHSKAKTMQGLLSSIRAPWRFGFSGTIPDVDTYDGMIARQWLGEVVLKVSNDELIERGISAKPFVQLYEIDAKDKLWGIFEEAKKELPEDATPKKLMAEVYKLTLDKGIVDNQERNMKVIEVAQKYKNKSILIVVDLLKHGNVVKDLLDQFSINSAFISGSSENRSHAFEKFKKGELRVLISTNIVDEGVDISKIEVLILLAGKKSRRQLLQRVGRGLRRKTEDNKVIIVDFIDYGSRYIENHSKQRLKIYKDENFDIEFI